MACRARHRRHHQRRRCPAWTRACGDRAGALQLASWRRQGLPAAQGPPAAQEWGQQLVRPLEAPQTQRCPEVIPGHPRSEPPTSHLHPTRTFCAPVAIDAIRALSARAQGTKRHSIDSRSPHGQHLRTFDREAARRLRGFRLALGASTTGGAAGGAAGATTALARAAAAGPASSLLVPSSMTTYGTFPSCTESKR